VKPFHLFYISTARRESRRKNSHYDIHFLATLAFSESIVIYRAKMAFLIEKFTRPIHVDDQSIIQYDFLMAT